MFNNANTTDTSTDNANTTDASTDNIASNFFSFINAFNDDTTTATTISMGNNNSSKVGVKKTYLT